MSDPVSPRHPLKKPLKVVPTTKAPPSAAIDLFHCSFRLWRGRLEAFTGKQILSRKVEVVAEWSRKTSNGSKYLMRRVRFARDGQSFVGQYGCTFSSSATMRLIRGRAR